MLSNKAGARDRNPTAGQSDAPRIAITEETFPLRMERSVYAPPASSRVIGLIGTSTIFGVITAGFFMAIDHVASVEQPPALTVVNLLLRTSPEETPPEEKEAPKALEREKKPPEPRPTPPIERTVVPIAPESPPIPVSTTKQVEPGPVELETAAPRTQPAPPAPKVSGNAPDTWEGRVLARLNEHRRYPRSARAGWQQGVPYIRFVMDRDGKVVSSRLERSSGFPDLDREAVSLPKRAQPLPKPPDDKPGDTMELVVPVQFFLH